MTARHAPLATRERAGYRILRSLARDEQAELLLGHRAVLPTAASPEPAEPGGADTEPVALKVVPTTVEGWRSVWRLAEVLDRAGGDHVVRLHDVDADESGIHLVFERLTRGDLAALLSRRGVWEAGEVVTVLAPLATALQRLHAAGVAHGALSGRTVMFRDDGAPTLIGFSGAELFESGAPEVVLEEIPAVARDRQALRGFAVTLLQRVAGTRARAARELLLELAGVDDDQLLPFLASRLFEVAAALPVRFTADESERDAASPPPRVVPIASPPGPGVGDAEPDSRARERVPTALGRTARALARLAPEPLVQRVLDAAHRSPAAPVARVLARRWSSWSSRRRRIVLAVGAGALTVAIATAVVPASGAASRASTVTRPTPSASASIGSTADGSRPSGAGASALAGDDPVAAASALLAARERCLASLSLVCLDGVDEAGSGALADDQAAIRAGEEGGELPDPANRGAGSTPPVLIERLGDSALVRLGGPDSGPASLLLVKGEAGWRLRDVIAAAAD